jgi:hypothetical protein
MPPMLPFRLKVPKTTVVDGSEVRNTSSVVHGYLQVDGDVLIVEWGGTVSVQEVGTHGFRERTEALPDERLEIHASDLHRAELEGGWFQPRLSVQSRRVGALAAIPTESMGVVNFWYDRSERFTAVAVAEALKEAIDASA